MVSQCTLGKPVAFQWHSSVHLTSQCTLAQGKGCYIGWTIRLNFIVFLDIGNNFSYLTFLWIILWKRAHGSFACVCRPVYHDDVIKWKHFPRYRLFCAGNSTVTSDAELWCFLWSTPEPTVDKIIKTSVIWDAVALVLTSPKGLEDSRLRYQFTHPIHLSQTGLKSFAYIQLDFIKCRQPMWMTSSDQCKFILSQWELIKNRTTVGIFHETCFR